MVKVGDKLEVMRNYPAGASEMIGAILTVTDLHAIDKNVFLTSDSKTHTKNAWVFRHSDINRGDLSLLNSMVGNIGLPSNFSVASTTNPVVFKVGDVVEWPDGSRYEIIMDVGSYFELKLIKHGNIFVKHGISVSNGVSIGSVITHSKNNFVGVKLVYPYGYGIYKPSWSNVEVVVNLSSEINAKPICECGKEKHGFASHSTWCAKHEGNDINV